VNTVNEEPQYIVDTEIRAPVMPSATSYQFPDKPDTTEYDRLAAYLEQADAANIHPSLHPIRIAIAARLRSMACVPDDLAHLRAFNMLRLFVF